MLNVTVTVNVVTYFTLSVQLMMGAINNMNIHHRSTFIAATIQISRVALKSLLHSEF